MFQIKGRQFARAEELARCFSISFLFHVIVLGLLPEQTEQLHLWPASGKGTKCHKNSKLSYYYLRIANFTSSGMVPRLPGCKLPLLSYGCIRLSNSGMVVLSKHALKFEVQIFRILSLYLYMLIVM